MKVFLKWMKTLRKAGHFDPNSGQALGLIGSSNSIICVPEEEKDITPGIWISE